MTTAELLTPEQVAEMLQVHPGTLENWRVRGEGPPFVKLGNKRRSPVRYRRQDVEDWIYTDVKRDEKK
jgi:predicted DNA-binding transcriptional regulator AlpA